MISFMRLLIDS